MALLLLASPARAKDLNIAAFFGTWQGNALSESEISANFQLTTRDIGVKIAGDSNGFTITWKTVQRQRGDPKQPSERLKQTSMQFQQLRQGVWKARNAGDPLASGAPYAWAHIERQSRVISVLQIYADGGHEVQVYRRSLANGMMHLTFTRSVDGEQVRTAKGRLVKIGK